MSDMAFGQGSPGPEKSTPTVGVSRRRFIRLAATAAALVPAGGALLAACGDNTATPAVTTAAPTTVASATTAAASTTAASATTATAATTTAAGSTTAAATGSILKSTIPGVPDAFLAPPPVFKATTAIPGKGSTVKSLILTYSSPPTEKGSNKYWQELEKRLGVTWEPTLLPAASYSEKLAVLTASGDLPDLTFVGLDQAPEHLKIIQQGAYTDLTPFLTGDGLKEFPNLAAYPPGLWKNVALKGKIYGVPRPRFQVVHGLIWRKDWAEKLGNPNFKNADEFKKLLQDITTKDPNGVGQGKTWGLSFEAKLEALVNFRPIMNMFRVPNQWRKDADGNLTYHIETEEYKQALSYMRELWKAGVIYPDSLTQGDQTNNNFDAGKFGGYMNGITALPGLSGRRAAAQKLNPKADVVIQPMPGFDGGKSNNWLGPGYFGFAAIPAKIGKDKEKVKELLRVLDYLSSPFGSEENNFKSYGIDGVHNTVQADGSRTLTDLGKKEILDLTGIANAPLALYYPGATDHAKMMQDVMGNLMSVGIDDPSLGAVSATWNSKSKELNQLLIDRTTAIITGRDSFDSLGTMINDWKSRGGSQVAKELAESLKA